MVQLSLITFLYAGMLFAQDPARQQSSKQSDAKPRPKSPAVIVVKEADRAAAGAGHYFGEKRRSEEEYQTVVRQSEADKQELQTKIKNLEQENAQRWSDVVYAQAELEYVRQQAREQASAVRESKKAYMARLQSENEERRLALAVQEEKVQNWKDKLHAVEAAAVVLFGLGLLSGVAGVIVAAATTAVGIAIGIVMGGVALGLIALIVVGFVCPDVKAEYDFVHDNMVNGEKQFLYEQKEIHRLQGELQ